MTGILLFIGLITIWYVLLQIVVLATDLTNSKDVSLYYWIGALDSGLTVGIFAHMHYVLNWF